MDAPTIATEPPWLTIAREEIGVHETPGPEHTLRILEYFDATRTEPYDGDETPWCAAFVSWCLERAGVRSARSAGARAYLNWGVEVPSPIPGAVAVLTRPEGGELAGHVTFVLMPLLRGFVGLGGNQGNAVSTRPYAPRRVLSYRWPDGVPVP